MVSSKHPFVFSCPHFAKTSPVPSLPQVNTVVARLEVYAIPFCVWFPWKELFCFTEFCCAATPPFLFSHQVCSQVRRTPWASCPCPGRAAPCSRAFPLEQQSAPPVCAAVLGVGGSGGRVVAHRLTVGRGRPRHPPSTTAGAGTDAWIAAGWAWAPTVHGYAYQVAVKYSSVGRCPHRLSVEFHLLFRVPELQGAGPLVRRRLLPVRQGDGGGKVNLVLHVGVGGLEAAEPIPLEKRWGSHPIPAPRGIHGLQGREERLRDVLSTVMTTDVTAAGKFTPGLFSPIWQLPPPKKQVKTIPGKKVFSFLMTYITHLAKPRMVQQRIIAVTWKCRFNGVIVCAMCTFPTGLRRIQEPPPPGQPPTWHALFYRK